ncbi:hypothetical protein D3C80_1129260 [compost metagenome]
MATPPNLTHVLYTVPFTNSADFTELADNCERFVEALVECGDPAHKMARCGRFSASLALLQPTLRDPIPEYLHDSLTVEALPLSVPYSSRNRSAWALLPAAHTAAAEPRIARNG